jgi:hypothetical protein
MHWSAAINGVVKTLVPSMLSILCLWNTIWPSNGWAMSPESLALAHAPLSALWFGSETEPRFHARASFHADCFSLEV